MNSEQPGTELPVHYWVPLSVAPSSLAVETHPATTELWVGALAGEMVVQLTLADNCVLTEQRLLRHQLGRIRDVRVDADRRTLCPDRRRRGRALPGRAAA